MTKIKCLIVDDEPIAQRIIMGYLSELPDYEVVDTCLNAIEAMKILQEKKVDLMFLDIEMPKLKGLAFLKTLQNPPAVIITTAHREYALEGFELEVLDYLLKPISFERFFKSVNRYQKLHSMPSEPGLPDTPTGKYLYVKSDRKTLKILEDDIQYIEGMNNYLIIHIDGKSHIVYSSLSSFCMQLSDHFLRIHKSYLINRKFIQSYSKESVEINGKELPIGKTYKQVIQFF